MALPPDFHDLPANAHVPAATGRRRSGTPAAPSACELPLAAIAVAALLYAGMATAQSAPGEREGHQPPPLPREAYTVCQGLAEGASVTLTMPDRQTLPGTCRTMNGSLVALPAGGPPGAGGPPPAR